VCFFEDRRDSFRFVQVCATKDLSSTFDRCNLSWIVHDSLVR
jgi:hypothetical protein